VTAIFVAQFERAPSRSAAQDDIDLDQSDLACHPVRAHATAAKDDATGEEIILFPEVG